MVWNLNPVGPVGPVRTEIQNPGVPCFKLLGGSKVDSAFHPSKVDKMSSRNFSELSGEK